MVLVCFLILTNYTLAGTAESRSKFTRLDVSRIFDPGTLPNVVLDHVPVALLQLSVFSICLAIIRFMLPRKLEKLRKCAPLIVLYEGLALGEILEHLVAGRQFLG